MATILALGGRFWFTGRPLSFPLEWRARSLIPSIFLAPGRVSRPAMCEASPLGAQAQRPRRTLRENRRQKIEALGVIKAVLCSGLSDITKGKQHGDQRNRRPGPARSIRLIPGLDSSLAFHGWLDKRSVPFPGAGDTTCE